MTATPGAASACSCMEHKGIRYELLQTIRPSGWKWIVHVSTTQTRTGFSFSKELAKIAAIRAIDKLTAKQE